MYHYLNKSFREAVKVFEAVTDYNHEDRTAQFFLNNAISYLEQGVPENWSGVVEMMSK
jgi:hypothetical protein